MAALDDFLEMMKDIDALRRRADKVAYLLKRKHQRAERKLREAEQILTDLKAEALGAPAIEEARDNVQMLESELESVEQELYARRKAYLDSIRDIDPYDLRVDDATQQLDAIRQIEERRGDFENRLLSSRLLLDNLLRATLNQDCIKTAERWNQKWDTAYKIFDREMQTWLRESRRRTAIAYCIAFESFLRDFLVEQAMLQHVKLEAYVQARQQLKVSLPSSLNNDEVVECIAVECRDFQDLSGNGKVKKIYESLFSKGPFAWDQTQSVFTKPSEQQDSLADIRLLFSIRHQLIHRNGRTGARYREALGKDEYHDRFDPEFIKNYPKPNVPGPDDILGPKSKAKGSSGTKLEEFAAALRHYAQYITEVF